MTDKKSVKKDEVKLNIKWSARDGFMSVVFLVAILIAVYYGTSKLMVKLSEGNFLNLSHIDNWSFSIFYGIQVILMLGVVLFIALYWRKARLRDLGLRYYSILKTIWYSFISLIFIFVISFLYTYVMSTVFGIEAPVSKVENLISSGNVSSTVLLVVVSIIAPICEEIYFRGFLYSAFKKSFGIIAALFLSSLIFAAAHMELYSFIPIMMIGWLFAYIFEKTKSLFTVIFLHGIYNLILILVLLGRIDVVNMY